MCVCARVCLRAAGCFEEQCLSCYTSTAHVLKFSQLGKNPCRDLSQVAAPGNLVARQTLPLPFAAAFAEEVCNQWPKRTEVRAEKEWVVCPRPGRRSHSPSHWELEERGMWDNPGEEGAREGSGQIPRSKPGQPWGQRWGQPRLLGAVLINGGRRLHNVSEPPIDV